MVRLTAPLAVIVAMSCGGPPSGSKSVLSPKQIVERFKPAIVRIENRSNGGIGIGTGFVVAPDGRIATNLHVIAGEGDVSVRFANGNQLPVQSVLAIDANRDLALIQVASNDLPTLILGNSELTSAGDPVVAIGNPQRLDFTVSDGLISSKRDVGGSVLLQISAPISRGSSGGPVFNEFGEVVGVATLVLAEGQNLNFAVPANYLAPLLRSKQVPLSMKDFAARFAAPAVDVPEGSIRREIPEHKVSMLDDCTSEQIVQVWDSIDRAIQLGAPLYNQGNHAACYLVYRETAEHLANTDPLCPTVRDALRFGLGQAEQRTTETQKAWALRDSFDGLLRVMSAKEEQAPAAKRPAVRPRILKPL